MTEVNSKRKLASIQIIQEIKAIPAADLICAYRVNGWWIVSKVNEFSIGATVLYIEIDSWVPSDLAPFLSKGKEPKEYKGIKGGRLRTVKLKKQLSQGLILSVPKVIGALVEFTEGEDFTDILNIQKWEPPQDYLNADSKGLFPSFIPKTEQERIQNCFKDLAKELQELEWEVTEKIHGQSATFYFNEGDFGVCSRNLELKDDDNAFWNTARKYNLQEKLQKLNRNIAIQGEQYGSGICGNNYKLYGHNLAVFNIFCIDTGKYLSTPECTALCNELGLTTVPIRSTSAHLKDVTLDELLSLAEGDSALSDTKREGLVFKSTTSDLSFKVVSNSWLLKND
jgi:RNA ligase (TIGR02306 family)